MKKFLILPSLLLLATTAFVRSLQRMKTLVDPKYIIPGHDASLFTRFPRVADGIVEIK